MQLALKTFFATLSTIFRSRAALELENLALRHQIDILQRSVRKRPKLTPVVHQNLAQGFEAFAHGVQLHRVSRDWLAAEGLALGMTW